MRGTGFSARLLPLVAVAVVVVVTTACSADGPVDAAGAAERTSSASASSGPDSAPSEGSSSSAPPRDTIVEISAVGDVIMGAAPELPPDGGSTLFDAVADRLTGDVVLGNLDQALTDRTTSTKCEAGASDCYAFRTPPSYAAVLRSAGFTVLNLANNHSRDFGDAGLRDTRAALTAAGLLSTGMPGQVTLQEVGSLRVAIIGFAPYGWTQSLLDIPAAQELVGRAARQADLVVVTIHAGGEGRDQTRVRPGPEVFLGENRGDSIAFSHAVIDAGADVVLGAGPHVLRGMEWYRGSLIAYSMGNFTGYRTLSNDGASGIGGILTVELAQDGTWRGGRLVATQMVDPGFPQVDPRRRAVDLVRELSRADFGGCGVDLSADGELAPPTC